jgi:hypothetical protein
LRASFKAASLASSPVEQKKTFVKPDSSNQLLGQRFLLRHVVVVAAMNHFGNLILQRRNQLGVLVAQRIDRNAAQCVQITFAIHIHTRQPSPWDRAIGKRP